MSPTPTPLARPTRIGLGLLLCWTACAHAPRPPAPPAAPTAPPASAMPAALPPPPGYAHGVRPSAPQAEQDQDLMRYWSAWKARYVRQGGACGADRAWVDSHVDAGEPGSITVSEAHGWGMLVTAMMAPYDAGARPLFDALLRFLDDHPSTLGSGLMAWDVHEPCVTPHVSTSAPDGDLDIAYALLVAHRLWDRGDDAPYLARARRHMAALMDTEAVPEHGYFRLWEYIRPGEPHAFETRTSDMMFDHFRAFHQHSGDARWARMLEKSFVALGALEAASPAGFFPDFAAHMETAPAPAPNVFRTDGRDGTYSYNACRLPMRWGLDAALHGDPRSQRLASRLTEAMRKASGAEPKRVMDGYGLGAETLGHRNRLAFLAPLAVGAMASAEHQGFLDTLYHDLAARPMEDEGYYGNALKMLAMIALTGRWASP